MDIVLSQLLSLAPVALIPFIPNGPLRYITLGLTVFACAAYFLCQNSPSCRVRRLEASIKEIDELFSSAVEECNRDPHFMAEAGLRLAGVRYRISTIRTKRLNAKHIPWRNYMFYFQDLTRSIGECRRELRDLWSSISVTLESTLQQKYVDDMIGYRMSGHRRGFPAGLPAGTS
ncbi:hypothetical protein DFH09DRAFT_1139020 [Mycena vulgaris]|nr:hypothetical protein DFH09DRAFT_1139020 [Mycena vulgaris]